MGQSSKNQLAEGSYLLFRSKKLIKILLKFCFDDGRKILPHVIFQRPLKI